MPRKQKPITIERILAKSDVLELFERFETKLPKAVRAIVITVDEAGEVAVDYSGMENAGVLGTLVIAQSLLCDWARFNETEE